MSQTVAVAPQAQQGQAQTTNVKQEARVKVFTGFTPAGVKDLVKHFYKSLTVANFPSFPAVILIGPPGVGKSTAVKEAAFELASMDNRNLVDITNKDIREQVLKEISDCLSQPNPSKCLDDLRYFVFLDLRLTEVEPTDLIGFPRLVNDRMEYAPPGWAIVLQYLPGILFVDELSNVNRPDVMAAAYKILLDRAAGFVKFHPHVLVVAAGNLPEHAPGVARSLPPPVVNRSSVIMVSPPTLEEWFGWMTKTLEGLPNNVRDEYMETLGVVFAFLEEHPGELLNTTNFDPKSNENFPSPRSWSHLVFSTPISVIRDLMNRGVGSLVNYLSSFVGNAVAESLVPYFKGSLMLKFRDIFDNPAVIGEALTKVGDIEKVDVIVGLIGLLAAHVDKLIGHPDKVGAIANELFNAAEKLRGGWGCSVITALNKVMSGVARSIKSNMARAFIDSILVPIGNVSRANKCFGKR